MKIFQLYDRGMWQIGLLMGGDRIAHFFVGMAIWLGSAALFRWPLRDFRPVLVLTAFEVVNELFDRAAKGAWHWPDTAADFAGSLFWPLVIFMCLKHRKFLRA